MTDNSNTHQMMTRGKRKRISEPDNITISIGVEEVSNNFETAFVELGEDFLHQEEREMENQEYQLYRHYQKKYRDKDPIAEEMKDFIVPDSDSDIDDTDYQMDDQSDISSLYSDEDIEESEIEKSERDLAEALASYINHRMDDLDSEIPREKDELFQNYDPKMRQHFLALSITEQNKLLELESQIQKLNNELVPLRYQLLNSPMDLKVKAIAMRKLNAIQNLDSSSGEYYKLSNYINGLMKIPFGKYQDLPVNKSSTPNEITSFLLQGSQILDQAVHGHQKAKSQILQTVGKWISNPQSNGAVFSILGPMGNGKTTLVKEGISKMIHRPFEFISLGGATDSSFLDGHSYTYEGAVPGKIVEILKKCQCMNPVIYFDELDKVSNTPRGEEIINLLIHLTDFSQNDHFMDKYYSDIPLDLSKTLFIFSLNNLENVNPILRDRMMMIQTDKLQLDDKKIISQKYMIPKILQEVSFNSEDIKIPDNTIEYAIKNYSQEEGVRNLKRCYENLLERLNILRLIKLQSPDQTTIKKLNLSANMEKLILSQLQFPLTITPEILSQLVEDNSRSNLPPAMMYS